MRTPTFTLVALAIAASSCSGETASELQGVGTLEYVESDVGPTVTARVVAVPFDEGAYVNVGDTVAILELPALDAQLEQQRARTRSAQAQLQQLERGTRVETIRRARAELEAAEAEAARATQELQRATALRRDSVISQQEFDVAQAAARRAVASRNSASAAWEQARNGARPEEIAAARAEVASAAAAARAVSATASDLVLLAPFPGVITSRNAEPGEVLAPGRSAVTVGRTARPWVRVYLGQAAVAQIKVGQRAEGRLDDFPSRTFPGAVAAISTRAEFTPRVALTEQERADMLFGVKVEFTDTTGMLKAGMPITVRVVP